MNQAINIHRYLLIFIDIYDTKNQYSASGQTANDNILGYSISLLDINLPRFKTIDDVEEFLKRNKTSGITTDDIETLINYYRTRWEKL